MDEFIEPLRRLRSFINGVCVKYDFVQVDNTGFANLRTESGNIYKLWACGMKAHEEGTRPKVWATDPSELVPLMMKSIEEEAEKAYKSGCTRLCWRRKPEFNKESYPSFNNEVDTYYKLTARYVFE